MSDSAQGPATYSFRSQAYSTLAIYISAGFMLLTIPVVVAYNVLFNSNIPPLDWHDGEDVGLVVFLLFLTAFAAFMLLAAATTARSRQVTLTASRVDLRFGGRARWGMDWSEVDLVRTSRSRGVEFRSAGKWYALGPRLGDKVWRRIPEEAARAIFREASRRGIPVDDPEGGCYAFGYTFAPPKGTSEADVAGAAGHWNEGPSASSKRAPGWIVVATSAAFIALAIVPALFGQPFVSGIMIPVVVLFAFRSLVAANVYGGLDVVVAVKFDRAGISLRYRDATEISRQWGDVSMCRCSPSEGFLLLGFENEGRWRPCDVSPASAEGIRRAYLANLIASKFVTPEATRP
jgi:hypothetical protein